MKNNLVLLLLVLVFAVGCKKKSQTEESYHKGSLTITTDESFKSVTEALADGYMISYPDSKITVETQKEDLAFMDLLEKKSKLIVMSRDLTIKEISEFERLLQTKYTPAKFAADGLVFVVSKDSPKEFITLEEINEGLASDEKPFVFDGTNSSNLNFIAQKVGKKPSELKFGIIKGNQNVIKQINDFPGKIGVIGLNTISRPYDKTSEELRNQVKILPIKVDGKLMSANSTSLSTMQYPFTRVLYFLTSDGSFNLAAGFIRYSCTDLGQKIVDKEGIQPYNIYKRQVQMR